MVQVPNKKKPSHPVYGHYTGQPELAGTSSKELEDYVGQSFTARMPLLMATSTFGLGRRRWSSPQQ